MATAKCIENIKKLNTYPPCTDAYCTKISFGIGVHCTSAKPPLNPDDPVGPQFDDNLNGPGKGGFCYCCCSCFAATTPIEVAPNEFALASEIVDGETILAAGAGLKWEPRRVEQASTWETSDGVVPAMYLVRYEYPEGIEEQTRQVIVSPDHLFLMEDNTLLAVQDLTKVGLKLKRADGQLSKVLLVAQGSFEGGVSTIQMEGPFDGKSLDGHLLNSNGIVSADYKVQVYYSSGRLSSQHLHQFTDAHDKTPVGTAEFHEAVPNAAYTAFINDPAQWPKGFNPRRRREIVPPAGAHRFLTEEQAEDIRKRAPKGSMGNTFPSRALLYLFSLARGFYPETDFLLDWENKEPNAYTWNEWGRNMVVFTGGLVRITEMGRDGLSLVLSAMLSYQSKSVLCVGEADYSGVGFVMHNLWNDNLYVTVVERAIPQIDKLFSYIKPEHANGDPNNPCKLPSIECRKVVYKAAVALLPIPECAKPKPDFFEVRDARALSSTQVQIVFTRALDAPTAETTENYAFTPETTVKKAKLDELHPNEVILMVSTMKPGTLYVIQVSNVISNDGVLLDPNHSTAMFTTKT